MKGKLLIAIFLFLFCTLSIEAFAIEPLFDTGIDYPTGDLPESFCSGDFNKDGFRDLIVVDAANDKILVFLNDKKNGFKNPIGYETGDWPSSIATADFNGDSYLDVVVITDSENSSDNLNILFNAADGTFMPPISYTIDEGGRFIRNHVLAVADVNGDGHQDIVVSNTKDTLFVFLNSGKGSFDKPIANIVRDGPHTLCAADFNQDGLVDIAGVRSDYDNYSICVFYSTAAGTFQAPLYYPTGRSPRHSIIASDFNNDSFIDLAVACFGEWDFTVSHRANSSLVVLLNQKDGAFKQVFEHTETGPLSLCAADFNGDTIKDLAVTYRAEHDNEPHEPGYLAVFLGQGEGGFTKADAYFAGYYPHGIIADTFGDDALIDLAVLNYDSRTVSILQNKGEGIFQKVPSYRTSGTSPRSVVCADFDGDKSVDIATADRHGDTFSILLNNGKGIFTLSFSSIFDMFSSPWSIDSADFNGDGFEDLVIALAARDKIVVAFNDGAGRFDSNDEYLSSLYPFSVTTADFNKDGAIDIAVANRGTWDNKQNTVMILLNDGTGVFEEYFYEAGFYPYDIKAGDVNNDGYEDLAVVNNLSDSVSIFYNNRQGRFERKIDYRTAWPLAAFLGDFNADGSLDIAVINTQSRVSVLLNNGNGSFQGQISYPVGALPESVYGADFNGDGSLDLAVTNLDDNTVSILLNDGEGKFQHQPYYYNAGKDPFDICAADFNGDTKMDLVVTNWHANTISILMNISSASGESENQFIRGDANADGRVDLADAIVILNCLFSSNCSVAKRDRCDVNDDGVLTIGDPIRLLNYLYAAGPPPAPPFPSPGADPTEDNLK